MIKSLFFGGLILLLASCGRSPGFLVQSIGFGEPTNLAVLQEKFVGSDQLAVKSDPVTDAAKLLINSGKLFVGGRAFSEGSFVDNMYTWAVMAPCSGLPQGDNITIRYELYDSAGAIVKQNSISGVKISTC